jgi:hypothetical protein
MTKEKKPSDPKKELSASERARENRRAESLRENLHRRKQQTLHSQQRMMKKGVR